MTTMCLHEATLLEIHLGDAEPHAAGHASDCVLCRRRLARLRADLDRIARHLGAARSSVDGPVATARPARRLAGS
jgi:hypothetical protein